MKKKGGDGITNMNHTKNGIPDLVSVVMPSYNHGKYIKESIESVLNQTYGDLELIIVDDRSSDGSQDIIKRYAEKDQRVRYIFHKQNKGYGATLNDGLKETLGEFITTQDSDDIWNKYRVEKILKIFKTKKQVALVHHDADIIDTDGNLIKRSYCSASNLSNEERSGNPFNQLLRENFVFGCVILRRDCLNTIGFPDTRLEYAMDWHYWINLSRRFIFYYLPVSLVYYRIHEQNMSRTDREKFIADHVKMYEIIHNEFKGLSNVQRRIVARQKSQYLKMLGDIYFDKNELSIARRHYLKSFFVNPWDLNTVACIIGIFGIDRQFLISLKERFRPSLSRKNLNILMLAPLFHPHIGGVEKHIKRLSKELIKKGHKISLITIKHNKTLPSFEELNKIKVFRFPRMSLPKVWLWIYEYRNLIKDADIIHCHDFSTFIYWYMPFRFLYPLKPVFITFHGFEGIIPIPQRILFKRKVAEFLTKGNICVGDFIPKWYGTKATFISYGGVDIPPAVNNTNSEGAVFIGRLEKDTGIMTYVNALKILKRKYGIDLRVNICGDGSLRGLIERFVRENELNVKLQGFVKNPTDYLTKSKFAFVSGYLAILEAVVNKKLVFSIYENELKKDYLILMQNSKSMMVVAPSPEELAEKIVYYYKNPEKAEEKINNAYNFAKEQTWENVMNTYLKLWGIKK